jgi:hypothetical protein
MPLESLEAFDAWLRERWNEKEGLLEQHAKTGSFPSDAEPIVTEVKLGHWMELWGIYGLLTSLAMGIAFLLGMVRWMKIA